MMHQPATGSGSQGFAAHPRVVAQKQKYKDPYGNTNGDEYFPQNIMHDKRVFRGSTNAAMVIPAGTYPDQLFQANKRKYDPKRLEQQRAKAAEEFFTRDVKTPEAPPGKQNIDIQTDQFVAELTDKAPVYEIGCQTEFKINRPPTPHKMPKLLGVSKKTLVEDNELFLFEDEVEPILSVLCGKTLEIARLEVLQEEELAEMRRQQETFSGMRKNEEAEIKKMEEAEAKRLDAHIAKKSLERSRREAKKIAHKKVVSRVLGKSFLSHLKVNAFTLLRDVGYFRDRFSQEVLQADVLPWLMTETNKFVVEINSLSSYPDTLISNFMITKSQTHTEQVKAYADMIKARRAAEQKAREDKITNKLGRKAAKEAQRKAEAIALLKTDIKAKFVDKCTGVEEILKQEITEVDGWSQTKPVITALGGWLGQLMIVVNTVAKYYPQVDRPTKTGRSGRREPENRPKSRASEKSAGVHSQGSEGPRNILNPQVIQNFIYTYILEKMKVDKFSLCVDARYEQFLKALANPMKLNEMRTLKENKYYELRQMLSKFLGSPILRLIKDHQDELDMDPAVFDLVYEGFWDLYTFHPQLKEVSARKLQTWITKVKLSSGPDRSQGAVEEADEDEEEKDDGAAKVKIERDFTLGEDIIEPIEAVVRIRIPKMPVEIERDDEGNEIVPNIAESDLEDIPFEDKCVQMVANQEGQHVWVFNHLAAKTLRTDISAEFRAANDRLDNLDTQDFNFRLEKEAAEFETKLLKLLEDKPENKSKAPKVPVFDFRPKY